MLEAVAGTYFDLKFIKTRKVAQMVIEVPIEKAGEIVALFGTPMPDQEVWCAVAPLKGPPVEVPVLSKSVSRRLEASGLMGTEKPKRKWDDIPASEQAGIACADEGFQRWIGSPEGVVRAAELVRERCGVLTRGAFDRVPETAQRWHALYARFQRETGRVAEERR